VRWDVSPLVAWTSGDETSENAVFTMPDGNVTITPVYQNSGGQTPTSNPPDPAITPTLYNVLEHFGTWTGSGTVTGRSDGPYSGFLRLLLDGNVVDPEHYTVTPGSTIITLHESYLKTLANGTHTFRKEFIGGYADKTLTVNVRGNRNAAGIPQTGDLSNAMLWWLLILASVLGMLGVLVWRKYRQVKGDVVSISLVSISLEEQR
jgi:hypothetical protein